MATNKLLYALRMPSDLKIFLDQAARSGGVSTSSLIIEACWKHIERRPASQTAAVPVAKPVVKGNAAMDAFMAKLPDVRVEVNPAMYDLVEQAMAEQRSCVECDKTTASKFIKGTGQVYACTDIACPMYGLERS